MIVFNLELPDNLVLFIKSYQHWIDFAMLYLVRLDNV